MEKAEVIAFIKYFCKKGISPKEVHGNFIKSLVDEFPCNKVKKWAADVRRGRESVENYERSGHPKEANTNKNVELVQSDHV